MNELKPGDRFAVSSEETINSPKNGRRLARYLPGMEYRVTPLNLAIVAGLIAQGRAVRIASDAPSPVGLGTARARVRGLATT